jgi:PncC family amidohydrolase
MLDEKVVRENYEKLTKLLIKNNLTITTMESCTAGQVISLITDTEGSSAVTKGAFVTYCNDAKVQQGVPSNVIKKYGVYSKETAAEMAKSCRENYNADIGVGITGTFGNTDFNNSDSKIREVYYAVSADDKTQMYHCTVPVQNSRYEYKLAVAKEIAKELLQRI